MIRPERPGDEEQIHALTAQAFAPMPYSDGAEPHII
ncbi:MAG: GNAT family N-acetyltransferase, partial [Pseudomonadota bacterium]